MKDINSCFKAYDIRGTAPEFLNTEFAHALGCAIADTFQPQAAVIGRDARLSSPLLEEGLVGSLQALGCRVRSLGLCGTEEIYHAAATDRFDLGIMITGSHNPANENGFKFVRKGAVPVSSETGLKDLQKALLKYLPLRFLLKPVSITPEPMRKEYADWLLGYAGFSQGGLKTGPRGKLRVVMDAGNGCAGPMLEALVPRLPVELIPLDFTPDGAFPNGVPNPLLPEKRKKTADAVLAAGADLGVAFDGDFDRCFFFDENGRMIESCYLIGLLARELLLNRPAQKVIHDGRVFWGIQEQVREAGGIPVKSRGGHSYMKQAMRAENAIYGGEMSAHHFFRDFAFCDSGMLAMLLVLSLLNRTPHTLAEMVDKSMKAWPVSGEINFKVNNPEKIMNSLWEHYRTSAVTADKLDGINLEFSGWRFNLRASNTEPLLRLNLESRGSVALVEDKREEIKNLIEKLE